MNLPSNVKIDFPFSDCNGCDRCEPRINFDETKNFIERMKFDTRNDRYTIDNYIINCEFEAACERLINKNET